MNLCGTLRDRDRAFTAQEHQRVANAIAGKCDARDGVGDGIVQANQAGQSAFNVQRDVPTCTVERTACRL